MITAKKLYSLTTMAILFLFLLCTEASAGLVVERAYIKGTAPDMARARKRISYFQDDKVKTVEPNGNYTIIDLSTGTMIMVNPNKKEYSVTSIDKLVSQMQKGMNKLKTHLKGLSPQQRVMMEKMMGISQGPHARLALKKAGEKQEIAGFETSHYIIIQNGKKVAEYWVSKRLRNRMLKEIDKAKIDKFEKAMNKISSQLNIFGSSSLTELMKLEERLQKKGEIVKQVHYPNSINMNGTGSIQEVISVRGENIPTSAFTVPGGFKKRSIDTPK